MSVVPRQGARRGVVELVLGTVVGQGLVVALSPVLSRLYTPTDFAVLQMFTGVVSVAAVLATLRMEFAIPLAEEEREARAISATGLWATVLGSILVGVLGWLTADLWAHGASLQGLRDLFWMVPPTIAVLAAFQIVSHSLVRQERYRDLAVRNAAQGVGTAAGQIGLGLAGLQPLGLLLGMGAGRAFGLVAMRRRRSGPPPEGRIRFAEMTAVLGRYRRFPLLNSPSTLINRIGQYAPYAVFGVTFGAPAMGLLTFAARLLAFPVQMVAQAVTQVYFGRGASTLRENPAEVPRLTRLATSRLALYAAGPTALVALLAPWLFPIVFGEAWAQAGTFLALLAIGSFAQLVAAPAGFVFVLLERQDVALAWEVVRLLMVLAAPYLAWAFGGSVLVGVAAYTLALVLSYLGVMVLAWWVMRRG